MSLENKLKRLEKIREAVSQKFDTPQGHAIGYRIGQSFESAKEEYEKRRGVKIREEDSIIYIPYKRPKMFDGEIDTSKEMNESDGN